MISYKQILDWFLGTLFPPLCVGCGFVLGDDKKYKCFCKECFNSIKLQNRFVCVFCDSRSTAGKTCPFCIRTSHLDQLLTAAEYGGVVRRAVKETKYRYIKNIAEDLSGLFGKFIAKQARAGKLQLTGGEVIIPVPLNRLRFNKRGFNQAQVFAVSAGAITGLAVADEVIERKFGGSPQADIKVKSERLKNAEGKYRCAKPELVKGKTIWLVDDVATTGSTLEDCARALKEAGASYVVGLAFAKGKLNKNRIKKLE